MADCKGTCIMADTNYPAIGLQLFDPRHGIGAPQTRCPPQASNRGEHWNGDHCPFDDGPVKVYVPQHTHPHPNFAPDDSRIIFTSDRTGRARVYECLPDGASPVRVADRGHSILP